MTLNELAHAAFGIHSAHDEAAYYDKGFDAGEFSGPWHADAAEGEVEALAKEHGFTLELVEEEMRRISHEEDALADNLGNYE